MAIAHRDHSGEVLRATDGGATDRRRGRRRRRLRLLSPLLAAPGGTACTCDLIEPLGLSQPTVTHHLQKLLAAGLVTAERRGGWTYHGVSSAALRTVADAITPAPG
ncbi:MAG: helix-turn-helix domain-containing protein [Actinomycetota bacterium]|nr:helix-turn-helix domain-containing protein [Actinomycetota bacterium]